MEFRAHANGRQSEALQVCWHFRLICSVARIRGLEFVVLRYLGLTPQALCLRLLRRLKADFSCKAGWN